MLKRVYVEVTAIFNTAGNVRPVSLKWTDGKVYEIDRIRYVDFSASETGSCDLKYTCIIEGKERHLFLEKPIQIRDFTAKWFLEVKE